MTRYKPEQDTPWARMWLSGLYYSLFALAVFSASLVILVWRDQSTEIVGMVFAIGIMVWNARTCWRKYQGKPTLLDIPLPHDGSAHGVSGHPGQRRQGRRRGVDHQRDADDQGRAEGGADHRQPGHPDR